MLKEFCNSSSGLRVFLILKYLLKFIFIIIPIILIISIIIMIAKNFNNPDDLKKATGLIIKKIIAAIIIFFLPSLFGYIFSLGGDNVYELEQCASKATLEEIMYYQDTYEEFEVLVSDFEQNPTPSKLESVRNKIASSSDLRGVHKEDFITRLDASEVKMQEYEKVKACKSKGGTYNNGYCYIPPKREKKSSNNDSSDYNPNGSGSVTDYKGYMIAEGPVSLDNYIKFIANNKVAETKDLDLYSGNCLGFSYAHAYGYYTGNKSITADNGKGYTYAGKFSTYINDSKQDVLTKVYNEISNGRPCIIQVNGNKAGTSRHFVTVVGVSKSATASTIQEEDLLIIDSYDGKLKEMNGRGSGTRFMISGADCHKDYSGYRMQYLK